MDLDKAYKLIADKLTLWLKEIIRLLPNLVLAALVMVLGFLVAKWIRKLAAKVLKRMIHNETIAGLFSSIIYMVSVGIFIFIALSILQLDKAVTSVLAGAGIIGLALAFAFQDIAANFMTGIFLSIRRPLHVGDIVKIKDYMGKVAEINLRDTALLTFQGQKVIIPNKDVLQNPIENFSLLGKRRMDLTVGVSYGDNLEKVRDITLQAVKDIAGLTKDETTFFYQEFADSSINFQLRIWVATPEQPDYLRVRSEAVMRIKKAYDEAGITIPFPIRTLDFGIKGGGSLGDLSLKVKNANGVVRPEA